MLVVEIYFPISEEHWLLRGLVNEFEHRLLKKGVPLIELVEKVEQKPSRNSSLSVVDLVRKYGQCL